MHHIGEGNPYRKENTIAAVNDRCCHAWLRAGAGQGTGADMISCPYDKNGTACARARYEIRFHLQNSFYI